MIQVLQIQLVSGSVIREMKPLLKTMEEFNLPIAIIITDDYERKENIKGKDINFVPLSKWLLEL